MGIQNQRPKPRSIKEKRKYPRIEAKVKVTFRTVEELIEEYARNISSGGIFLKTDRLLDPNAVIDLSLEFPEDLGEFFVKGKVVRLMSMSHPTDPEGQLYGAGIRFIEPDPKMIQTIQKLVERTTRRKAGQG